MKYAVILFFVMGAVMAAPAEEDALQEFIRGNRKFTAGVYKELIKTHKGNIIMSPFSAETVLALTTEGARGDTALEMSKGLSLPSTNERTQQAFKTFLPQLTASEEELKLLSANRIYVGEGVKLEEKFRNIAENIYKSGVENVNFAENVAAASTINRWVEDQTNNRISDLIKSDSIDSDTKMVLVNALYFSGEWVNQFEDYATTKKDFYRSKDDSVKVDMMAQTEYFRYYENPTLNAKFLELPYKGRNISMVIALPNERNGLAALEQNIEAVLEPQPFKSERVEVQMPRFTIESEIKFVPILQNLGVNKLFGREADLSGLSSTDKNLYVSDVIQKAFINVTETGTEAAAATAVMTNYQSAIVYYGPPPSVFHANHSFVFSIVTNNVVIFSGRIQGDFKLNH
ncbi:unnamed protein product [Phaedon cochleariae]|uniref:Serpin domain-containing protein n=1 Tax=Phaedon cochleariae TaxID=80249 RepID=A0A9N9SF90_PHACE|nr:unnamed protein product [Phaedon cochleariae]